ncbi:helix-turn-helix domain-containing protein [Martelella lutilitoris]|uniref:helix-turn-helix domain-containing protein n=1 Tax=Martelella lutilitoris TaxID=2583532 RepID=UPI001FF03749|nr:helix-turn-helix domain-containing protein [Martelella lutilitoris]
MIRSARDFCTLVRARRKACGWTQTELARRAGTGERFIVELEAGKPNCQLEKALIVARAVGLELGDLKDRSRPGGRNGTRLPADFR